MSEPTVEQYIHLLEEYIPVNLIKACYESIKENDPAHNVGHIFSVCDYAMFITDGRIFGSDKFIVLTAALMHDLGCRYNREFHHQIAFGLVYQFINQYAKECYTEEQIHQVAIACLEHRASWGNKRSNLLCEYVALADRGIPNLTDMIERCRLFRMSQGTTDYNELFNEVFQHMKDKVSSEGYMWNNYPRLGWQFNGELISGIQNTVDDNQLLSNIIHKHFEEKGVLPD